MDAETAAAYQQWKETQPQYWRHNFDALIAAVFELDDTTRDRILATARELAMSHEPTELERQLADDAAQLQRIANNLRFEHL